MGDNFLDDEDPVASLLGASDADAVAAPPPPPPPPPPAPATTATTTKMKADDDDDDDDDEEEEKRGGQSSTTASSHMMMPTSTLQANSSSSSSSSSSGAANNEIGGGGGASPRDLNEELADLLLRGHLPQTSVAAIQSLIRENASLKEKNGKLKSLLGRSAKAQRDAKNELESMRRSYELSKAECDRLEKRVEVLASRPTHMDLLADFETNFDRALLSIGGGGGGSGSGSRRTGQSGGEDASESSAAAVAAYDDSVVVAAVLPAAAAARSGGGRGGSGGGGKAMSDPLLITELNESRSRIAHLESLNASLQGRCVNLERSHAVLMHEQQTTKNACANMQLELRMSRMETEHASRCLREKEAIVAEMQLEIDLVTRSAVDANRRAAEGMEAAIGARNDREYVDGLEAKVTALQEWALASTESKRLTSERCRGLEMRVKELEGAIRQLHASSGRGDGGALAESDGGDPFHPPDVVVGGWRPVHAPGSGSVAGSSQGGDDRERNLWTRSSSLVVGAGMVGHALLELGNAHIEPYETVVLRWKFDLTPGDLDIYFSILKGACEDKKSQRGADACFRHKHVQGGGGGDVGGAFAKQNACTLLWSNEMSWVRPRTIKWTVDAIAIEWSD